MMSPKLERLLYTAYRKGAAHEFTSHLKTYKQPTSNFDEKYYMVPIYQAMYNAYQAGTLEKFFEASDRDEAMKGYFTEGLSLKEFMAELNKLDMLFHEYNRVLKKDESLKDRVVRRFMNNFCGNDGWMKFYTSRLESDVETEFEYRIYLAVDNSSLHRFASALMSACKYYGVPYEFKINNAEGQNQYDNFVFYTSEENLAGAIKAIQAVLARPNGTKLNQPCLIAYPYDENIRVAPEISFKRSYSEETDLMLEDVALHSEGKENFVSNVDYNLDIVLQDTQIACSKVREQLANDTVPTR